MINVGKVEYKVLGLMSGTSLDGLDIAFCRFTVDNCVWSYEIISSQTVAYSEHWKKLLLSLEKSDAIAFQQAHIDYGYYLGAQVADFIIKYDARPDFISSHGHTIFHQPEKKLSIQVGSGNAIAARCKLPVVFDFRSLDVALGGQGAPLVPIGDQLLFGSYDFCLNLGGFANVSYQHNNKRIAYDICPVNIVMNAIAEKLGNPYDDGGEMAKEGMLSGYLLNELNQLGFYKMLFDSPKSLGKEWVLKNINPILEQYELSDNDILRTFCEHVAFQIGKALKNKPRGKLLITGGGVYNTFLMECIRKHTDHEIIVPDKNTIEYKEALIFALLGVLRLRNEINCLKSVTGADQDCCSGTVVHI